MAHAHLPRPARRRGPAAAAALGALCGFAAPLTAQGNAAPCEPVHQEGLGSVCFVGPDTSPAREDFLRGVLLLHSFEYDQAAGAFREARRKDPDHVLAYWGEAMTHNHPVWMEQDRDAARAVLEALGPTREARLARAGDARERAWLETVEVLYGDGSKEERDDAYRDAMRRLHERWPDDLEARAFYALSILGSAHEGRDFATYMRAAAVAWPVFEALPRHPGAVHYLIHSFDDPVHAPLGLPAARAYSEIAPRAAHAQHMTSHIFVALGLWDDVVRANERARDVQNAAFRERGVRERRCGHYPYWLEYGYLMQGRHEAATRTLEACAEELREAPEDPSVRMHYELMRARYVLDTGRWDAARAWPSEPGHPVGRFVDAMVALRNGDPERAGALAAGLAEDEGDAVGGIHANQLRALVLLEEGRSEEALRLLEEAAGAEAALPFEFGPPAPTLKPVHELRGEVLLELGRPEAAAEAFRAALARTPRRTPSLEGLARAAEAAGDTVAASEAREELAAIRASGSP